jgi:hypothetical protein
MDMIDCCDLTWVRTEAAARVLIEAAQVARGRPRKIEQKYVMIDNNSDNNPQRHRWTQDDTAYREIQQNSYVVDVYGQWWTKRGELQNRRLQVRFLSHLPEIPELMGVVTT